MPKRRRSKAVLAGVVLCAAIVLAVLFGRTLKMESAAPLRMLFTYPITYLSPVLYDDWETVFVGNHIYVRLLPEDDKPSVPYLTKEIDVKCVEPAGDDIGPACRKLRVAFAPRGFADCAGRRYEAGDIRKEFEALLAAKSWSIPGWRRCDGDAGEVCVTGKNTGDIRRRLKNLNFRFGWSKQRAEDTVFGAGPYCLKARFNAKKAIETGILEPMETDPSLPRVEFAVGGSKDSDFDVALYGTRDLLKGSRLNMQAHTPLAYYVVTNPALAAARLPWNNEATRDAISAHFVRTGVFFPQTTGIEKLVPGGAALDAGGKNAPPHMPLEFALPDYLPGCQELAAALTAGWKGRGRAKASCTNIVTYIQSRVREKRGRWSGFLVGLSPADPGRDSLKLQYFSKDSPDSLTYEYPSPDALFYRVGIGQSLVTVDGQHVCDLRPNVLGLGDIFATDFIRCRN